MNAPRVSVLVITYNQRAYLAAALDSALAQETRFPVEIVVGDDASTDGTSDVVRDYAARHPDRIRPLLHPRNLGGLGKGNFLAVLAACRGEYVAMLEGDDYWTSPHKLQRQVDHLDQHAGCALCFHDAEVRDETAGRITGHVMPSTEQRVFGCHELLIANFPPTCSLMWRRAWLEEFPPWFHTLLMGDWSINLLLAGRGTLDYLPEAMAVYRVHRHSHWSSRGAIDRLHEELKAYECFRRHLGPAWADRIDMMIRNRQFLLAQACAAQPGGRTEGRAWWRKCAGRLWRDAHRPSYRALLAVAWRLYGPVGGPRSALASR